MKPATRLALAFLLLSSAAPAKPNAALARSTPVPATEPVPVVDFFRPLMFRNPKINPAGTHVAAYYSTDADRIDLVVHDVAANTRGGITAGTGRDITTFNWLDERRLLFSVSRDKRYAYGLFMTDVADLRGNIAINARDVGQLVGVPRKNPLRPLVWIRRSASDRGADHGVVQFDASRRLRLGVGLTEDNRAVAMNDGENIVASYAGPKGENVVAYMADRDGELAFCVTVKDGVASLQRWTGAQWIKCPVDLDALHPCAPGEKPGELLVIGPRQAGKPRALQRLDALTGSLGEILHQNAAYDFTPEHFHFRQTDQRIVGVNNSRGGPRTTWFDPAYESMQAMLDQTLSGWAVRVLDMDRAGKKLLIRAASDRHPGRYFFFDLEQLELVPLGSAAPWIDPVRMRPMELFNYRSRDGIKIEACLTLPAGETKASPPPLVVLAHGGPWVRDNWGWDAEAQFLASRGYIVFQPNYRGSTGDRWRFSPEDAWDFRKMHQDVSDGVDALVQAGLVDSDRIAIMGGSFGAYLALCGAAYEPRRYRCAIAIAGVFDWEQALREARGDDYSPVRYGVMKRHLGDPKLQGAKYESISPLRHVEQIKIPIFVAHGTEDKVASVAQSKRLIRELKKNQIPHQVQIESGEGHGFQHLDNQVELYSSVETFLAKYLAPKTKAP